MAENEDIFESRGFANAIAALMKALQDEGDIEVHKSAWRAVRAMAQDRCRELGA